MKRLSIGILLVLFSSVGFAQQMTCLDKLLPYNRHSGLHQLTKEEWTDGLETLSAENAKVAVTFLTNSKLLCKTGEVVIKVDPICSFTVPDLPQSNTCFVFTNVGYFILSRDVGRNTNFIFSKDRRFGESI